MSDPFDVIVIGGGPSGVAAALELRRLGVKKVVILDREPALGGATRHCSHSPFGMREFGRVYFGAAYGRRLEAEARNAGVDVRTGHSVVQLGDGGNVVVTSARGVETLKARRILMSTGAREKPRSTRLISGDRPIGVLTTGALQAYIAFHGLMPFRRPVIVGSELVSQSALLTCLTHGARPAAMVEGHAHALAPAPFSWFPKIVGVPFHSATEVLDIRGTARVEEVTIRKQSGAIETIACDGVLLTGQFTPESALFLQSPFGIDAGSAGPSIDQFGRTLNPVCYSAGNVLRAVETGGWAFQEGRSVGAAIAGDLSRDPASEKPVPVTHDAPIKLVVPNMLRQPPDQASAFADFQLRFHRRIEGELSLEIDGRTVWSKRATWLPERRVLVPIPPQAARGAQVHFHFREIK